MLIVEGFSGFGQYENIGFETCGYLKYGSNNNCVGWLQRMLNELGYNIKVDGIFGPQTRDAVVKFQKQHGLKPDGVVGPQTWAVLKSLVGGTVIEGGTDWKEIALIGAIGLIMIYSALRISFYHERG